VVKKIRGGNMKKTLVVWMIIVIQIITGGCSCNINKNSETDDDGIKIFCAWNQAENFTDLTETEKIAAYDLYFDDTLLFNMTWETDESHPYEGLSISLDNDEIETALSFRSEIEDLNPNIIILCEVLYREGEYSTDGESYLDPLSDYWLMDEDSKLIPGYSEDHNGDGAYSEDEIESVLIDFTSEEYQEIVVQKISALEESGLYDGIFLDWWSETSATTCSFLDDSQAVYTAEEEKNARISLLEKIRDAVGDDFLILVNSNTEKLVDSAEYINGVFMECNKDDLDTFYTDVELAEIEDTLFWASENLAEERINCLEAWRTGGTYNGNTETRTEERNSEDSLSQMRFFTAMSLIFSDSYVNFVDHGNLPSEDHLHNWYTFWDTDIGNPISEKGTLYNNTPGLYIREFENAWIVYNRSGSIQTVNFSSPVRDVTSDGISESHSLENYDGGIYLFE
jgi:hypothetical protein